ncbi:PorV/PorQ family protein [Candidatus Poribacteria bacterium]|nr:PorV/PorQ family protein [Candidatus Poribacteria bacterium]
MQRFILAVLAIFFIAVIVTNQSTAVNIHEDAGTRGAQLLKIAVGAKAVGMGESHVAAADDVYATYWNPAGLGYVETNQLGFMHNEWFEGIRYEFLGYVQPLSNIGTMAATISYISMGELDKTDETGKDMGQFHPYDILIGLSFGRKLNDVISFGINAKFLREQIDEENAQAFAADIGGIYAIPNSNLVLGANVQHIGTKMKFISESYSLPLNLKFGAAYRLIDGTLTLAAEVNRPVDNDVSLGFGAEYKLKGIINFRTGYIYTMGGNDLGAVSGLRAGLGVDIRSYKLDYAFVPYGDLGQAHRISLIASF